MSNLKIMPERHEDDTSPKRADFVPGAVLSWPQAKAQQQKVREQLNSEQQFMLGVKAEESGDIESAIGYYEAILKSDHPLASAAINLGTIVYNKRLFPVALRLYQRGIELDSGYALAYFDAGNVYDKLGRYSESAEAYKEAIRLSPNYGDAHYNLALIYERLGEDIKALRHWQKYIRIDPVGPWTDHAKAQAAKILSRSPLVKANAKPLPVAGAVSEESVHQPVAEEVIEAPPQAEPAAQNLVMVVDSYKKALRLAQEGNIDGAIDAYVDNLSGPNPRVESAFNLGEIFYERSQFPEALELFQSVIERCPDEGLAHFAAARCYYKIGDIPQAIKFCESAIEHDPYIANTHFHLAFHLDERFRKDGQFEDKINALQQWNEYLDLRWTGNKAKFARAAIRALREIDFADEKSRHPGERVLLAESFVEGLEPPADDLPEIECSTIDLWASFGFASTNPWTQFDDLLVEHHKSKLDQKFLARHAPQ